MAWPERIEHDQTRRRSRERAPDGLRASANRDVAASKSPAPPYAGRHHLWVSTSECEWTRERT